jgi:aspartate/methionine/tyrosine aminotransferase
VNDNPYSFVLNDNPMSLLQVKGAKDVALELNSLSKTLTWRAGVGMVLETPMLLMVLKVQPWIAALSHEFRKQAAHENAQRHRQLL